MTPYWKPRDLKLTDFHFGFFSEDFLRSAAIFTGMRGREWAVGSMLEPNKTLWEETRQYCWKPFHL